MKILIKGSFYYVKDFSVLQVPNANPLPLEALKPQYRKIGNTIGQIPMSFLEPFDCIKEYKIVKYIFKCNNYCYSDEFNTLYKRYLKLLDEEALKYPTATKD